MRKALKSLLLVVAVAVVAFVGAVSWIKFAPRRVPAGQAALATLSPATLPGFREAFNAAEGEVRILALLSPT